jgi:hypothetical protein
MSRLLFAVLFALIAAGIAAGQGQGQSQPIEREVAGLRQQLEALQSQITTANLLAAARHLASAEFHAMDKALNEGEVNPRYLQTVGNAIVVVRVVAWPQELQGAASGFVEAAEDLAAALEAEDVEGAAQAASAAHDTHHLLSSRIFAYLSGEEADHEEGDESAETQVPPGAVRLELELNEQGGATGGAATMRVKRGATVALVVRSAVSGSLHLHGYDVELELRAGEASIASFAADTTGRYPMEVHAQGADDGVTVGYLEIRP